MNRRQAPITRQEFGFFREGGRVEGNPPVNVAVPVISGTVAVGQVLSTTVGSWTGTLPLTYTYQWMNGGVDISGATNSTYVLMVADDGDFITVAVTATNAVNSASVTAVEVGPVGSVPANVTAPVVTGVVTAGSTVSVTNGTWTGTPAPTFGYQWKRDGANLGGATAGTYVLVAGDIGAMISCAVTGTNVNGATTAVSAAVGPIVTPDQLFLAALPSGFAGAWIADNYSATPRPHIPNLASAVAAPKNLFSAGRRWFDASGQFWTSALGATIVDNAVVGPDGRTEAATINLPNTAYLKHDITLPAGTYTLGISVGSNSGTDQTGQVNPIGKTPVNFTALASGAWQEASATFTMASPALITLAPVYAHAGAINLKICNARLYAGSTDFGPEALGGHMLLGKNAFDASIGSVSGGTWNMVTAWALAQFPTATSSTSHTFMAAVAKTAAGSTHHVMFTGKPSGGASSDLAAILESGGINIGPALQYSGSGTTDSQFPGAPQVMLGDGHHVIVWRYNVTTGFRDVWIDGHLFNRVTSAALPARTFIDLMMGMFVTTSLTSGHRFAGGVYWPRALTDAEIR